MLSALLLASSSALAYDFSAVAPTGQTLYYNITGNNATLTYPGSYISNPWSDYTKPTGNLTIPSSVTYGGQTYSVASIGDRTFYYCSDLTSVTIPYSVASIGNRAFYHCSGLTSVTIPNSVTSIGLCAFYNCSGLNSVTIPNSVTSIGNSAFEACFNLTSVIFNAINCTSMGSSSYPVFSWCTNLSSLTIGESVQNIPNNAFRGCSHLASLTIPNSVTSIGNSAFSYCSSLTSLTIPNTVTSIGNSAFEGCSDLTSLSIGSSVTSIGERAFYQCSGLTSITSEASTAPQLGADAFTGITSTIPVNIPCGSSMSYFSRWSYFSNFVESAGFTFNASSSDNTRGSVQILTEPTCTDPEAVIYAAANTGYLFDHWSDGITDNPRSVVLISDTSLIAYFVSSDGIGDINKNHFIITANNSQIVISNAANQRIRIFDNIGRLISTTLNTEETSIFNMPASGVYLVQVGNASARRVVVIN